MSLNKIENQNINELKITYNLEDIKIIKNNNMIIVIIRMDSERLNNSWKSLNSLLSDYLEAYLDDIFTRWNIYILYAISDEVNKELQYKIENNTFFARKIIKYNYNLELTDENIEDLIAEHIAFTDLVIDETQSNSEVYISISDVYSQVADIGTLGDNKIDDILLSLEKDVKNEI